MEKDKINKANWILRRPQRNIYAVLTPGFANRLNNLVAGFYLSKLFKLNLFIHEVQHNDCLISMKEVFNIPEDVLFEPRGEIYNCKDIVRITQRSSLHDIEEVLKEKHVLISEPLILDCISIESAYKLFFEHFDFKESIKTEVEKFLSTYNLSEYVGCQVRTTDYNVHGYRVERYIDVLKPIEGKIFLSCERKEDQERLLKEFPTAIYREKKGFVEKLDESKDWQFNVIRDKQCVLDAIVDLILLSQTKKNYGSIDLGIPSTFFDAAETLKKINYKTSKMFYNKTKVNKINFSITNRCNRSCPYCCYGMPNIDEKDKYFMSLEEVKSVAKYFSHLEIIRITGGEPSFNPYFEEISREIKNIFPKSRIEIETNGFGFEKFPDSFLNYDQIIATKYGSYTFPGCKDNNREIDFFENYLKELGLEHKLLIAPTGHRSKGNGNTPCVRITWGYVSYINNLLYPCYSSQGQPGAVGIPLTDDWEERIKTIPLSCKTCVFAGT